MLASKEKFAHITLYFKKIIIYRCWPGTVKETSRRRIAVTSSLNEMTKDQLGNFVVMRGSKRYSVHPQPFLRQVSGEIVGAPGCS